MTSHTPFALRALDVARSTIPGDWRIILSSSSSVEFADLELDLLLRSGVPRISLYIHHNGAVWFALLRGLFRADIELAREFSLHVTLTKARHVLLTSAGWLQEATRTINPAPGGSPAPTE